MVYEMRVSSSLSNNTILLSHHPAVASVPGDLFASKIRI
jgi:hypothetical protein